MTEKKNKKEFIHVRLDSQKKEMIKFLQINMSLHCRMILRPTIFELLIQKFNLDPEVFFEKMFDELEHVLTNNSPANKKVKLKFNIL